MIELSFCPKSPRMVAHFDFDGDKKKVMENIRHLLIKRGFKIKLYAPNESFMFTQLKSHNWGTGERVIGLIVQVEDKITLTGVGKMDVPVSGIGSFDSLLKIKNYDRLPYKIQKKIFFPLIDSLDSLGFKKIDSWP